MQNPLPICAYCRFWEPVYEDGLSDSENPGSCTGQVGKLARWNGIWMKATDGCNQWKLSPARANLELTWLPAHLLTEAGRALKRYMPPK